MRADSSHRTRIGGRSSSWSRRWRCARAALRCDSTPPAVPTPAASTWTPVPYASASPDKRTHGSGTQRFEGRPHAAQGRHRRPLTALRASSAASSSALCSFLARERASRVMPCSDALGRRPGRRVVSSCFSVFELVVKSGWKICRLALSTRSASLVCQAHHGDDVSQIKWVVRSTKTSRAASSVQGTVGWRTPATA